MSYYSDASLVYIPAAVKNGKTYSVKPTDGTGDLTFTRASNATRVASNGLIEKVRTNLALYSQEFDNAYWNKSSVTISANATTAPDGTLTAEKLIEGSGTITPELSRTPIATSNSIFTLSVFAKAGERDFLIINNNTGLASARAWFNLSTGVVGTTAAGTIAFIESVGNGWYRCSLANQILSFGGATSAFQIGSADGVQTYTGDGTSGIFIWGAQMELGDIATDYIATTTAAVSVGPVSGLPRLDYLNSSCPKLLLEPQRTNLALYSEQTDNAYWGKYQCTITANDTTSPDGYTNADKITNTISTGSAVVYKALTSIAAGAQTMSFFIKAGSGSVGRLAFYDGTTTFSADYNLTNGTATNVTAGATATIAPYANDWYRCTLTATSVAGTHYLDYGIVNSAIGQYAYIFGLQFEAGAYATSYIGPTLGTSVTRVAESASKTGISSLIGQTEGTLYWEGEIKLGEQSRFIFCSDGTTVNFINILTSTDGEISAAIRESSVTSTAFTSSALTAGVHKIAFAYKANDSALYIDGVSISGTSGATVPATSRLDIGSRLGTDSFLNSGTSQALLFKTRLTNAQLAELTA